MKRLITIILGTWFAGAVVMSIYYEFKLKADCIKEEGLVKGFFWCSKQPITGAGLTLMQTSFLIRGIAWPYFLFFAPDKEAIERGPGEWGVIKIGTPFTVGTAISIPNKNDQAAILLVFFNPKNSCAPELGTLIIENGKLGDPIKQDKTSTLLQISVGDMSRRNYATIFNTYTFGIEYAMRLEDALLSEMKKSQSILIEPNNFTTSWIFRLDGFKEIADHQYAACRAN